ncbi:MAG: hypothetical protein ACP5U2_17335 [Bryobacteraceae bacterium]
MPRFIFHAHAHALAGFLRKPLQQHLGPHCACVLATVGGRAVSRSGPFRLQDSATARLLIGFDEAEAALEGLQLQGRERRTQVRVTLRGLSVLDVLRAGEVTAMLAVTHRGDNVVEMDTSGSGFRGLTLGGKPLDVQLDHVLAREASDYAQFRRAHPELPETRGITRHSLARSPLLQFQPWEPGFMDEQGFGRVYFCEWSAAPYRQSLIMLRLRLGSPAEGELEIGALEADGHDYP